MHRPFNGNDGVLNFSSRAYSATPVYSYNKRALSFFRGAFLCSTRRHAVRCTFQPFRENLRRYLEPGFLQPSYTGATRALSIAIRIDPDLYRDNKLVAATRYSILRNELGADGRQPNRDH